MAAAEVNVTLRVGAAAKAATPMPPHGDIPRGGLLPFTGASVAWLVTVAIVMLVLGTIFLLHANEEER